MNRRRLISVVSIVFALLLVVSTAAVTVNTGSQPVSVEVVDYWDSGDYGAVDNIVVKVTNHRFDTLKPEISILTGVSPYYWERNETPTLDRGESAYIHVWTERPFVMIESNTSFIARANHPDKGLVWTSEPTTADVPTPVIKNPRFEAWSYDDGSSRKLPYAWKFDHGAGNGSVALEDTTCGVELTAQKQSSADWTWAKIWQEMELPEQNITLSAKVPMYEPGDNPLYPKRAIGYEIHDGTHAIWVIFDPSREGEVHVVDKPQARHIIVPATPGEWSTATVNITQVYSQRAWSEPEPEHRQLESGGIRAQWVTIKPFVGIHDSGSLSGELYAGNVSNCSA